MPSCLKELNFFSWRGQQTLHSWDFDGQHYPCMKWSIKVFTGHMLKDENKSYSRFCSIPLGTLRPHTQQLRHTSYNLLKSIAVDAVSSDQGGQGYFLAKNLNDLTALETNLFQLFVCILQAWGHEEGEALNYVKLWRKERHSTLQSYSS